ncbi:MAG: ABC transporter family substrate-binding protein, partial [Aquiluna sp.]|nr:ABC transporter family substrate-binding protein [Aquiluna sp.]
MKKFRGTALVASAAAFALTISGCAATEELTPTASPSETAATAEWYEDLAPQITVGWNDIIDTFNTSSAAGNNVGNSLTAYLTSSGFNYYDSAPALV